MNPKNFIFIIILALGVFPKVFAPMCVITLEEKLYFDIRGKEWEKREAVKGFREWCKHYKHTPQEVYDIIEKESNFDVWAKSKKGAMGLMQVMRYAIESLPDGTRYYRFYYKNGRKVWIFLRDKDGNLIFDRKGNLIHALHKKRIYNPYYNIKIGCQYLRICKDMARKHGPDTVGRFTFSTNELTEIYYVAGHGTYHQRIKVVLGYIQ